MKYQIRNATKEDLPRIEEIYAYARRFMEQTGNPNQWGKTTPQSSLLVDDIEKELLFVLTEENIIHGVFYFFIGPDPTYGEIEDGCWRSDTPYGTIHRIAGDGSGGILRTAVAFAKTKTDYIRIDTHANNTVMHNALANLGFRRCGIIFVEDGSERIAYDLLVK
jgi:hypothetical protein